jgi:hypothetical protein
MLQFSALSLTQQAGQRHNMPAMSYLLGLKRVMIIMLIICTLSSPFLLSDASLWLWVMRFISSLLHILFA